jgi:hypothetical protein
MHLDPAAGQRSRVWRSPPWQARGAYRQQQLVQASHELDASTIAMFPTISHADRAACLRRANLIAISAEVVRNDVLFGCLRAMEQNQEASHP